jgi:glycosyltransferase involved in cell wall biosynthesis
MNIGWDLVNIPPNKDGTFEFTSRWLEAVATYPAGHRHVVYANAGFRRAATHPALDGLSWRIAGDWDRSYQLHAEWFYLRHRKEILREVDVLVSVWRPPLSWAGTSIAIVLDCTWERLSALRNPDLKKRLQVAVRDFAARRAGRWMAISEWTRRDVSLLRGYDIDRIRAVGIPVADIHALPTPAAGGSGLAAGRIDRRYAFYCSAVSARKNHIRLIRAWKQAFPGRDILLVLAGRILPSAPPEILDCIRQAEEDGVVRYLGLVDDAVRERLYAGADFVVLPSLYEGFGMPILEALRHGKPVLTSAGSSTEEVGGEAALLCDPTSEADMAEKLRRIVGDEDLRSRLRAAAPAVLERYSLENVARQLHEAIQFLAGPE